MVEPHGWTFVRNLTVLTFSDAQTHPSCRVQDGNDGQYGSPIRCLIIPPTTVQKPSP